jgi:galactose mutarotase-like enzyme
MVGLRNADIEVGIVPALGARVVSLKNRRTDREWCWRRAEADWLWSNLPGDSFADSPHAGFDECLPTIAPCQWEGRRLPDHGELWARVWQLDESALGRRRIITAIKLDESRYFFRREISLCGSTLTFDYALTNLTDQVREYLWAVHPLLAIKAGDYLALPAEVCDLWVEYPKPSEARGEIWAWPQMPDGVRLDRLELPARAGGCAKTFAGPLAEGRAAVINQYSGERLTLEWDAQQLPWLGIWLTRGGYQGWHHLALEPTNSATDALDIAANQLASAGRIGAHASRHWRIAFTVS